MISLKSTLSAAEQLLGDIFVCEANVPIPTHGEIIEGIAIVDRCLALDQRFPKAGEL